MSTGRQALIPSFSGSNRAGSIDRPETVDPIMKKTPAAAGGGS
jgi:hypothetical protein